VWANLHYYWAMAKDSWYARSWRDKLYVWIAPPGWHPADVAARFPQQEYDPHRDFVRFDPPRSLALNFYALVQLTVLIGANSHFLSLLPKQPAWLSVAYFVFILASLATLGGVLENRREFLLFEGARVALAGIVVLVAGAWFGGDHDPRIVLSLVSFALVSLVGLSLAGLRDESGGLLPSRKPL